MTFHERTVDRARGHWRSILLNLGVPDATLVNRHVECPFCGKKNFRWDNKDGDGGYICTCGSEKGMRFAMSFTGENFQSIAARIDAMLGSIRPDEPVRPAMTDEKRREALIRTWKNTQPVEVGDLVHRYLEARGVEEMVYPPALRFGPKLTDGDGGVRPCMVALIGVPGEEKFVSMHRTFLAPDGSSKAVDMESPRKMMPGSLPEGACVMLSDYTPGGVLGIAEGIETAMSASALYDMPVWSALNSSLLAKWVPPAGCHEVVVFGDNDRAFGGQAAAYTLAHRLTCKGIKASVLIPKTEGEDWNDILLKGKRK